MKLPSHYHTELMALVVDLEAMMADKVDEAAVSQFEKVKQAVAKLGIKSQATAGHYYSPVVNPNHIGSYYRKRWDRRNDPAAVDGVDFHSMKKMWENFLPFIRNHDFAKMQTVGKRYHLDNIYYGISDASILVGILHHFRPNKYFEIGSGFSSALALDVAEKADWDMEFTFVEPYPEARLDSLLNEEDRTKTVIEKCFVQDIPLERFKELKENDILFIDSTHVSKSGSDVIYLYLEVLNAIPKGVIVHVHDIFFPFEYPPSWAIDQNRSWNEVYMLEALISKSGKFDILFFNDAFGIHNRDLILNTYPAFMGTGISGGSIWLRRL